MYVVLSRNFPYLLKYKKLKWSEIIEKYENFKIEKLNFYLKKYQYGA